jgi:hypothetical protein
MDIVEPSHLEKLIEQARRRIYLSHRELSPDFDDLFRHVDGVIGDQQVSALEKAMFLLVNQYVGDQQDCFGSREIHEELKSVVEDDTHTNRFVNIIENVVAGQTDALTRKAYHRFQDRTGYTFGNRTCPKCDHHQFDRLELPTVCRKCGEKLRAQRP